MEVEFGLAVIGEEGGEFETPFAHEGEVVDGTLEDFHGDASWEGIHSSWVCAVEVDFFWSE